MEIKSNALCITCYCGIARILPSADIEEGDTVYLPPCPNCGASIRGVYRNDTITVLD